MKCPKCNEDMAPFNAEGVDMDICDKCGGVWFDKGELAFYTETTEDVPELAEALGRGHQTVHTCPRCPDSRLVETEFVPGAGLMIDICGQCKGVFLDKGEVGKVEKISIDRDVLGKVSRALGQLIQRGYGPL